MDQAGGWTTPTDADIEDDASVRLFNDVYFQTTSDTTRTFAPFPRLPAELRLDIWLAFLRQYRMIEVQEVRVADTSQGDDSEPQRYARRNHLGKIVSGRGYTLGIRGRGYAATLSPLLWINRETRDITLNFYRVHFPFPKYDGDRLLYLNPKYDVLYIQDMGRSILADLLHDVKAHDPKDQGLAHLAIHHQFLSSSGFVHNRNLRLDYDTPWITPNTLHPAAAESFADILRTKLRSVLCVINFRSSMRGIGEAPGESSSPYHFAQTFPLRRRALAVGACEWFESDPRWGVEFDLLNVPLVTDPRRIARSWETLEQSFGIERAKDDAFRLYICPALYWPGLNQMLGKTGQPEGRPRQGIAEHLRQEADDWLDKRQQLCDVLSSIDPNTTLLPRDGALLDAERFEKMESAPSTAIGMWLFPPEAFKSEDPMSTQVFDVSATRPGLLLFDV